jgi:hypothetical protein
MWMTAPDPAIIRRSLRVPGAVGITTMTSAAAVVVLALAASPVLDACRGAAEALLVP